MQSLLILSGLILASPQPPSSEVSRIAAESADAEAEGDAEDTEFETERSIRLLWVFGGAGLTTAATALVTGPAMGIAMFLAAFGPPPTAVFTPEVLGGFAVALSPLLGIGTAAALAFALLTQIDLRFAKLYWAAAAGAAVGVGCAAVVGIALPAVVFSARYLIGDALRAYAANDDGYGWLWAYFAVLPTGILLFTAPAFAWGAATALGAWWGAQQTTSGTSRDGVE